MNRSSTRLFARGSWLEASRVAEVLRTETVGGVLLVAAAVVGILAANTSDWYADVRDSVVGPSALHLDLSLGTWAADGLLAIFFFVVGLELKREFVAGDLRDPRRAAVPMVAALGGMVAPALIFTVVNLGGAVRGWAIPTATDIAFAVAVLALLGSHLPTALRTFLLTLAIVDDLLAITVIAIFYTESLHLQWLALAALPIGAFAVLVQRRIRSPWLLVPLAVIAWALVHASGIHATVAGVLLGFTVPVLRRDGADGPGLADHLEHVVRPLSAGIAVPVFAFFSAGVVVGGDALSEAVTSPITIGVVIGLVAGKTIGILGATWLMSRFTSAELDDGLSWWDLLGMAVLAGIGFTVSLLIAELAYGAGSGEAEHAKLGVLLGTLLATVLAAVVLRTREHVYRAIAEQEARDDDADGIPDVYQRD